MPKRCKTKSPFDPSSPMVTLDFDLTPRIFPESAPPLLAKKKQLQFPKSPKALFQSANPAWTFPTTAEQEELVCFWLGQGKKDRQRLVCQEQESALRLLRAQQALCCQCAFCGRRRVLMEEELCMLYGRYGEELEVLVQGPASRSLSLSELFLTYGDEETLGGGPACSARESTFRMALMTVAADLHSGDGRRFFSLFEKLAERRLLTEARGGPVGCLVSPSMCMPGFRCDCCCLTEDEEDYQNADDDRKDGHAGGEEDSEFEDIQEDPPSTPERGEEEQIEEGRRIFLVVAAKALEQRVVQAFRKATALDRLRLLALEQEAEEKRALERAEAQRQARQRRRQRRKGARSTTDVASTKTDASLEAEGDEESLQLTVAAGGTEGPDHHADGEGGSSSEPAAVPEPKTELPSPPADRLPGRPSLLQGPPPGFSSIEPARDSPASRPPSPPSPKQPPVGTRLLADCLPSGLLDLDDLLGGPGWGFLSGPFRPNRCLHAPAPPGLSGL